MIDISLALEPTGRDYQAKSNYMHSGYALCHEHDVCRELIVIRQCIWGRDEGMCQIHGPQCQVHVALTSIVLDHVVPVRNGGKHCWYNVQTACAPCNNWKGNR